MLGCDVAAQHVEMSVIRGVGIDMYSGLDRGLLRFPVPAGCLQGTDDLCVGQSDLLNVFCIQDIKCP